LRFLIDAQLPPRLAHRLNELGHEAVHVFDLGLATATALAGAKHVMNAERTAPVNWGRWDRTCGRRGCWRGGWG